MVFAAQVIHGAEPKFNTMNGVSSQPTKQGVFCDGRREQFKAIAVSIPGQRAAGLVFNDTGLEKVAFFLQVDHFAHPGEGVFLMGEQSVQANLGGAAVGDVAQIAFEHGSVHAEHTAWHGVFRVTVFQFDGFVKQLVDLCFELGSPQMRVF